MDTKKYTDFISLVKRMREAQMDKNILEMRLRFKIDQDEKISDEDNAEFATAMYSVVFYEDKVDEYLKKMDNNARRKALEAENTEFDYGHNVKHCSED